MSINKNEASAKEKFEYNPLEDLVYFTAVHAGDEDTELIIALQTFPLASKNTILKDTYDDYGQKSKALNYADSIPAYEILLKKFKLRTDSGNETIINKNNFHDYEVKLLRFLKTISDAINGRVLNKESLKSQNIELLKQIGIESPETAPESVVYSEIIKGISESLDNYSSLDDNFEISFNIGRDEVKLIPFYCELLPDGKKFDKLYGNTHFKSDYQYENHLVSSHNLNSVNNNHAYNIGQFLHASIEKSLKRVFDEKNPDGTIALTYKGKLNNDTFPPEEAQANQSKSPIKLEREQQSSKEIS